MTNCPECGSETREGMWLRWCSRYNRCKWVTALTKEERESRFRMEPA